MAVTNLSGVYEEVISKDPGEGPTRRARAEAMTPGNLQTMEGREAVKPKDPPQLVMGPGPDFYDSTCQTFGVDSRAELRRLEDFLAPMGLILAPVSSSRL